VDLAVPDHAGEGVGVVSGDLGGLGQGQQLVALVPEGLLDPGARPLEGGGRALSAEGLAPLLGLGADLDERLTDGALQDEIASKPLKARNRAGERG